MANESEQPGVPRNAPPAKQPVRGGFRVLVIDDNATDREIITRYLGQAWPFERELILDHAVDGRQALQKIRSARFALIVLDWKLPELGGSEVLRDMRQHGVRIPVVVLSGLRREHIHEDLDSLGAAFLNKDEMNPETFRHAIATSLRLLGLTQASPVADRNPASTVSGRTEA